MRALVVDDSRAVRLIIGKYLNELGIEVLEATNGRDALARMKDAGDIELVLVDWNMPEMNGLDFIKALRADPVYKSVRIIMVTTETECEQLTRALGAGADEYIMKPFTKDILVAKLNLLDLLPE